MITCVYLLLFYYLVLSVLYGLHTAFHHSHPHGLTHHEDLLTLRLSVGPLFPVLSFLLGSTRPMGASDIFLFLSLGLHLILFGSALRRPLKGDASF